MEPDDVSNCDGLCENCYCGANDYEGFEDALSASYDYYHEHNLRTLALTEATKIIVAVNQTQAWVPLDSSLFDMMYSFLTGTSTPDPHIPAATAEEPTPSE